jgi:biotin carboxyl carrier protein
MKLKLKLNGKPYEIEASPQSDGGFVVALNGREFETSISGTDGGRVDVRVCDTTHSIEFDGPPSGGSFSATANGKQVRVESGRAAPPRRAPAAPKSAPSREAPEAPVSTSVPGAVVAPMPGTVIAIERKAGDKVEQGDKIMTIEAMKMENEIRADKAGTVKEIRVSIGTAVLAKDVLAVIE